MTREQFISNLSPWSSYLPLLWEALEHTYGDFIELGIGDGSTKKLNQYAYDNDRFLFSYESDIRFYKQFESLRGTLHHIEYVGANWQPMIERHREPIGVLFSDEAPGEMRKYNIAMFCNLAQVVVAHDAEESNDHGYKFSLVKPLFKYHKLHDYPGASTIALSNFIDVSKWAV